MPLVRGEKIITLSRALGDVRMEQLGGPITTMPPNELAAKVLFSMDDDTFGVPAE